MDWTVELECTCRIERANGLGIIRAHVDIDFWGASFLFGFCSSVIPRPV